MFELYFWSTLISYLQLHYSAYEELQTINVSIVGSTNILVAAGQQKWI